VGWVGGGGGWERGGGGVGARRPYAGAGSVAKTCSRSSFGCSCLTHGRWLQSGTPHEKHTSSSRQSSRIPACSARRLSRIRNLRVTGDWTTSHGCSTSDERSTT